MRKVKQDKVRCIIGATLTSALIIMLLSVIVAVVLTMNDVLERGSSVVTKVGLFIETVVVVFVFMDGVDDDDDDDNIVIWLLLSVEVTDRSSE